MPPVLLDNSGQLDHPPLPPIIRNKVSDFPIPPPKQKKVRGAELIKAKFLELMDKTYFSILKLKDITEEEEQKAPPTPHSKPNRTPVEKTRKPPTKENPTLSTTEEDNVTVTHNPHTTTPTQNTAAKKKVTVCQEVVPAGLSKFISRDRKLTTISNTENTSTNKFLKSSKFSKTKISRKWSEAKLESGAKFTIQQFLEHSSPIVSTRPLRKQKKNNKYLF